ncbi:GPI mannosyltransferase 1 [Taenia solium]|eukprot:TsM_000689200 transcript=TsM_000689200 gene=TsM_000689200
MLLFCYYYCSEVPSVMSSLLKELKFYISLAYGALACELGTRTWYDRINDKLVLGALPILPHWDAIRLKEGISHVISMVEPFEIKSFVLGPREAAERGISYLSLPVEDFVGVPTNDQVDASLDFIDSCRRPGDSVYIHCKAGRTRSAFIVTCYFMSAFDLPPEEAVAQIQSRRPHIIFNSAQWRGLRNYFEFVRHRPKSMKTGSPSDFAKYLLSSAILLRLGLFIFSLWQDATRWPDGQLRFTDVDYDVFTDAAKAMVTGANIYEARPTYRYSPLIALLLWPGHLVSTTFRLSAPFHAAAYASGKVIFLSADIFCALLQRSIILTENASQSISTHTISWLVGAFWLFNPVTATVSVRGNAESILGLCVLACLWSLLQDRVVLAGLLFGLCVHVKLYPVIYAPVIYLQLCDPSNPTLSLLPTRRHWHFGLATLAALSGLTWASYAAYGWTFLDHAYFYHFTRVDLWHNFAPHFYPIYLFEGALALNETTYDSSLFPYNHFPVWLLEAFFWPATLQRLYALFKVLIMLPSALLITGLSFRFWHTPSFAWFAITFVFVTFNKVSPSISIFSGSTVCLDNEYPLAGSTLTFLSFGEPALY